MTATLIAATASKILNKITRLLDSFITIPRG
jgi:hypothetical protein